MKPFFVLFSMVGLLKWLAGRKHSSLFALSISNIENKVKMRLKFFLFVTDKFRDCLFFASPQPGANVIKLLTALI